MGSSFDVGQTTLNWCMLRGASEPLQQSGVTSEARTGEQSTQIAITVTVFKLPNLSPYELRHLR